VGSTAAEVRLAVRAGAADGASNSASVARRFETFRVGVTAAAGCVAIACAGVFAITGRTTEPHYAGAARSDRRRRRQRPMRYATRLGILSTARQVGFMLGVALFVGSSARRHVRSSSGNACAAVSAKCGRAERTRGD
jgi:hypothetical protein